MVLFFIVPDIIESIAVGFLLAWASVLKLPYVELLFKVGLEETFDKVDLCC